MPRGSLVKRYKNSWTLIIPYVDAQGEHKQKWVSFKGIRPDAQRKLNELIALADAGKLPISTRITVKDFLLRYLKDYAYPQLAPTTAEGYESIIRTGLIPGLGNIQLSKLTREHIQNYYNQKAKTVKAQTVVHHHTCLHKALEIAVEWNIINHNPADKAHPPAPDLVEMECWDAKELNKFLETAKDTKYYDVFYTNLFSGMRRSEILALRWSDLAMENGTVRIWRSIHRKRGGGVYYYKTKTKKSTRSISLTSSNLLLLKNRRLMAEAETSIYGKILSDDERIFPFYPDTVSRAWADMVKKAGVKKIRLHDGRHTHASILFQHKVNPKIVQERLGHSTIRTTLDTYSHMLQGIETDAMTVFDDAVNKSKNSFD